MDKRDKAVGDHIEDRLLDPPRPSALLSEVLDRREDYIARCRTHITELRKRASEADAKLKRLHEAIEQAIATLEDPALNERVAELSAIRDQARADAERAAGAIEGAGPDLREERVKVFAGAARNRLRKSDGSSRRDHLRAVAQRIEVIDQSQARIIGFTHRAAEKARRRRSTNSGAGRAAAQGVQRHRACPPWEPKWRSLGGSNPCYRRERPTS